MTKKLFKNIRHSLEKTQREMGVILGMSTKAVQGFEQGWRNIPVHVERQILFLLAMRNFRIKSSSKPCWETHDCPAEYSEKCPARELGQGYLCWMINGTWCHGKEQRSWKQKMKICRNCETFTSMIQIPVL